MFTLFVYQKMLLKRLARSSFNEKLGFDNQKMSITISITFSMVSLINIFPKISKNKQCFDYFKMKTLKLRNFFTKWPFFDQLQLKCIYYGNLLIFPRYHTLYFSFWTLPMFSKATPSFLLSAAQIPGMFFLLYFTRASR